MIELLSTLAARPSAPARAGVPVALLAETFAVDFDDDGAAPPSPTRDLYAAALDESDRGVLLVSRAALVLHANHAARLELRDESHPLALDGRQLRARRAADAGVLREALHAALQRGLRKRWSFGFGDGRISVSVVPLRAEGDPGATAALLQLGKRSACEALSVQCWARDHGLTPAEERVLAALCRGVSPGEIAREFGVRIATVRTQIGSIRAKTGAESIRALARMVAALPPLMGVLRLPQPDRRAA